MSMPDFLLLTDAEIPAWERDKAKRVADLMAERNGTPISAHSSDLPPGLPPPFDMKWSRGRGFTVTPDDEITLRAFGPWR
jgi:hypothetical protein